MPKKNLSISLPTHFSFSIQYQYDPDISRPGLVSAHAKWLICSNAFFTLGNKCETRQKYVPDGYFFETGRRAFPPKNKKCKDLTGNDDDVTVVKGCKFKKGLTMVLPAVNFVDFACNLDGTLEDPRLGPQFLSEPVRKLKLVKATVELLLIHIYRSPHTYDDV